MPANGSAGYSVTPLARKLGIGAGTHLLAIDAPRDYAALLAPVTGELHLSSRARQSTDIVHVFATSRDRLQRRLTSLRRQLRADASIWVSWPKKAARLATDITEDIVREVALPLGLVDIKVCAVDEIWSGLKLVVRRELRR